MRDVQLTEQREEAKVTLTRDKRNRGPPRQSRRKHSDNQTAL